jgi:hypothetical protein
MTSCNPRSRELHTATLAGRGTVPLARRPTAKECICIDSQTFRKGRIHQLSIVGNSLLATCKNQVIKSSEKKENIFMKLTNGFPCAITP